jgi:hypothetical protein
MFCGNLCVRGLIQCLSQYHSAHLSSPPPNSLRVASMPPAIQRERAQNQKASARVCDDRQTQKLSNARCTVRGKNEVSETINTNGQSKVHWTTGFSLSAVSGAAVVEKKYIPRMSLSGRPYARALALLHLSFGLFHGLGAGVGSGVDAGLKMSHSTNPMAASTRMTTTIVFQYCQQKWRLTSVAVLRNCFA